ncbi:MAG TPA: hypothetical protein VGI35_02110 [Steroidobacteraceae bacterium]
MHDEQNLESWRSEDHRFFPEWADRPQSSDRLLEADHNSYLAGGYSEEFGYRVRPGLPAVFPPLEGDPDHNGQWAFQIDCLHPGYPECARPADRGAAPFEPPSRSESTDNLSRRAGVGNVLQVNRRGADRHVARFPMAIGALWSRLRIRARVRAPGL